MTRNEFVTIIAKYCVRMYKAPDRRDKDIFTQRVYEKAAVMDILNKCDQERDKPVRWIIEEYEKQMDEYSTKNLRNSYMFSVARDVATDILDRFFYR